MPLFKSFGKTIPLSLAVLLLFCAPVHAEEKVSLSEFDNFYVLAHKVVDYAYASESYIVCAKDQGRKGSGGDKAVRTWISANKDKEGRRENLSRIHSISGSNFRRDFKTLGEKNDSAGQQELCDTYLKMYKNLEFPPSILFFTR